MSSVVTLERIQSELTKLIDDMHELEIITPDGPMVVKWDIDCANELAEALTKVFEGEGV
jgi:hypothetical protein